MAKRKIKQQIVDWIVDFFGITEIEGIASVSWEVDVWHDRLNRYSWPFVLTLTVLPFFF